MGSHLALPWITFAVIFLPLYVRMLRGAIVEVLDPPYVLTAHAKGAGMFRVLRVHVFRNAMLQPLTMIGMEIGLALTVAIYIETMFTPARRGTARDRLARLRLRHRDRRRERRRAGRPAAQFNLPVLAGVMFMIALTVIVLNLIVDVTYALLDPRIRLERPLGRGDRVGDARARSHVLLIGYRRRRCASSTRAAVSTR